MTEGIVVLLSWLEFLVLVALILYFVLWRRQR